MTKALRVFISSTSEDLKRYRAAAAEIVRDAGLDRRRDGPLPPDPDPIVVMCQRQVSECDLFLLLRWFKEQVQLGLGQIDRCDVASHEEVGTRIERLFHT